MATLERTRARPHAPAPRLPAGGRLFLLSFLILFCELALIRWTGAEVIYLSYFTNFVLLASFLGIGLGFLRPHPRLFAFAPAVLAALVCVVYFFPTRLNHSGSRLILFGGHTGGTPIWIALPIIFVAVAATLAMLASEAALAFGRLRPLAAYRYDILGSLAGIAVFSLMSLVAAPPFAWGLVVAAVILALTRRGSLVALQVAALAVLLVPFGLASFRDGITWSPYYAIKTVRDPAHPDVFHILVNGIPHQTVEAVAERTNATYYQIPYERLAHKRLDRVLVVGAGNGVDVALALKEGAKHVDAVEIDPRLLRIGKRLNPNRPYADPRVHAIVTDGRAYVERTKNRYDLILFALPDSLTLIAGQSSLRLESYLFTIEAMRAARARLKPDGVFAMYNFYRQQWLIDRFGRTVQEAFGHPPCVDELTGYGAVRGPVADLVVGRSASATRCKTVWRARAATPAPATDDHPFPYLRSPGVPGFYLLTLALILAVSLVAVRGAGGAFARMRPYVDLFFMGMAFLLLETKSVVQFALLFGTTWIVNAFVFGGVLVAVLLAIETAERVRVPRLALYAALGATLLAAWLVPAHTLLPLSFAPRLLCALALTFVPIYLANLLFADRFKGTARSTTAFAANLLGAVLGGLLEYSALAIGYGDLILVTAGLYALALAAERVLRVRTANA